MQPPDEHQSTPATVLHYLQASGTSQPQAYGLVGSCSQAVLVDHPAVKSSGMTTSGVQRSEPAPNGGATGCDAPPDSHKLDTLPLWLVEDVVELAQSSSAAPLQPNAPLVRRRVAVCFMEDTDVDVEMPGGKARCCTLQHGIYDGRVMEVCCGSTIVGCWPCVRWTVLLDQTLHSCCYICADVCKAQAWECASRWCPPRAAAPMTHACPELWDHKV